MNRMMIALPRSDHEHEEDQWVDIDGSYHDSYQRPEKHNLKRKHSLVLAAVGLSWADSGRKRLSTNIAARLNPFGFYRARYAI